MIMPYLGAALASLFFRVHFYIDNMPEKQTEPMQILSQKNSEHED